MTARMLARFASLALLTGSLAVGSFATGSLAHAQGPMDRGGPMGFRGGDRGGEMGGGGFHSRGPGGMWWKNTDLATRLGLTADQQKRMDDIFLQSRVQLIHIKATLEEQELMLRPLMDANPPDSAKALVQIGKIADTRAELEKANAKMLLGIRGVLTADQWTKLHDRERNRGGSPDGKGGPGGMRGRRGPGGQGGPGGPGGPNGGPGGPNGAGQTPPKPPTDQQQDQQ